MRIVEILVALSAIGSIATFLGLRAVVRKTLRTLGRQPEDRANQQVGKDLERREP